MEKLADYTFLLKNPVVWSIFLTAIVCYCLLIELCFVRRKTWRWDESVTSWIVPIRVLLSALPLLGLLGTIAGLLKTFLDMSVTGGFNMQQLIAGGIAEAMFTTQLGLVLVVPGLLMHTLLVRQHTHWVANQHHEIEHRKQN